MSALQSAAEEKGVKPALTSEEMTAALTSALVAAMEGHGEPAASDLHGAQLATDQNGSLQDAPKPSMARAGSSNIASENLYGFPSIASLNSLSCYAASSMLQAIIAEAGNGCGLPLRGAAIALEHSFNSSGIVFVICN